jgi:predicted ester cyclase
MSTSEVTIMQQRNKEIVRRLFAAFTANDVRTMDELLARDFTAHGLAPELGAGAAAMKGTAAVMHAGLHDCHCEIEDLIAEKGRVAVRYTARATHVGELFGVLPSGRTVTLTGIEIYRLADGRIAEYWGEANMSELFAAGRQQARASGVSA